MPAGSPYDGDVARPLIAIVGELTADGRLSLPARYAAAVARAGGLPLAVAPGVDGVVAAEVLERVDGLLFAGGDDFDTERLGLGPTHPAARPVPGAKQDFDLALARAALADDVPVLGVCYGMQVLALAGGGRLLQHLPDDRPGHQEHRGGARHAVRATAGTKLARLLGVDPVTVISRHHQALAEVGLGWTVAAEDDEGLIEAVEHPGRRFALGTQWHPELEPAGGPQERIFRGLIEAAAERGSRAMETAAAGGPGLAP
jgi:gamma-glutamyl-gamma-aminobutyrate hydrolase PuuD